MNDANECNIRNIAPLTVSSRSLKAAAANPVTNLRSE